MGRINPIGYAIIGGIIFFVLVCVIGAITTETSAGLGYALIAIYFSPFVCLLTFLVSALIQKEWSKANKYTVIVFTILFSISPIYFLLSSII